MDENDAMYTDNDGHICEGCFDQYYTYTVDDDIIERDRAVYAYYRLNRTDRVDEGYFDQDDVVYCDDLDEYWHCSDVVHSSTSDVWVPEHMTHEYPEYFPEMYPTDEDEDDDSSGQADKDSVEYAIANLPVKKEAA